MCLHFLFILFLELQKAYCGISYFKLIYEAFKYTPVRKMKCFNLNFKFNTFIKLNSFRKMLLHSVIFLLNESD